MVMRILTRLAKALLSAGRSGSDVARQPFDRRDWTALVVLLGVGLCARLAAAVLLPSVHHPDETFQYWEQAFRFAFGEGMIPWEYRVGIRSYFVPGVLAGVMGAVAALGGGMAAWSIAIQLLLSSSSLLIIVTAYAWARRVGGRSAALMAGLVTSIWFEAVYFSAKPLTEVMAAAALFPATYLLGCRRDGLAPRLIGGSLLGLTFVIRFQLAPAILVVAFACLLANGWRRTLPAATATVLIILAGGMLDWISLGTPFQSVWLNFVVNAIEGKSSQYGVQPAYWFALVYTDVWSVFLPLMLVMIIAGTPRAPLLLTLALVIIASHSLIAHKEYRFVYPALPFLLTLASIGVARLVEGATQVHRTVAMALVGVLFTATSIGLALQDQYRPNWVRLADTIAVFNLAATVENACGIGLANLRWVDTPGYRGLGKTVPIYPLTSEQHAKDLVPAYNVLIARDAPGPIAAAYSAIGCVGGQCVYARPGACSPQPDQTVNPYLVRRGE